MKQRSTECACDFCASFLKSGGTTVERKRFERHRRLSGPQREKELARCRKNTAQYKRTEKGRARHNYWVKRARKNRPIHYALYLREYSKSAAGQAAKRRYLDGETRKKYMQSKRRLVSIHRGKESAKYRKKEAFRFLRIEEISEGVQLTPIIHSSYKRKRVQRIR